MSMIVLAMLQVTAVASPEPARPPIVVTAKRLSVTERELADCIARRCPPGEEIDAALAHAENQFVAGDYTGSRRTLLKARARNAQYAARIPIDVADLHRANARLASLNGHQQAQRIGQIDSWETLRNALPPDDPRVLMQRLLVGDAFLKDQRPDGAREVYASVAKRARAAGQFQVEGYALLRTAILETALASVDPGYRNSARHALARISATTEPELAPFRTTAAEMSAQLTSGERPLPAGTRGSAAAPPQGGDRRAVLVYAPPIDVVEAPRSMLGLGIQHGERDPQWADLSFRIASDGTVHDVETLRTSDHADGHWLDASKRSVAGRRYQPLAGGGEMRRVERFSYLYDVTSPSDTRVRGRAADPRIDITDLTVEPRES